MRTVLNSITGAWSAVRIVRLLLGLLVTIFGAVQADGMMLGLGLWFTLAPLLNLSCCGAGGCDIDHTAGKPRSFNDATPVATFEEIKSKE